MQNRPDLATILAANLKYFMSLPGALYRNPNALATAAKIAPNTVRNYLDPSRRTTTVNKPEGFPTLDKLQRLASALNCQVWELLHPDIQRSLREREMYRDIEKTYAHVLKAPQHTTQKR